MPLYIFTCPNCKAKEQRLLKPEQVEHFSDGCRVCGSLLTQTMSKPESRSMETTDEYRGKANVQGVDQMIEDRAKEHDRKNSKSV